MCKTRIVNHAFAAGSADAQEERGVHNRLPGSCDVERLMSRARTGMRVARNL